MGARRGWLVIASLAFAVLQRAACERNVTRGALLAFGCSDHLLGREEDEVFAECHPRLEHFERAASGAVACLRFHAPDLPVVIVYPTPRFNRTIPGATHYLFDKRVLAAGLRTKMRSMQLSPFDETVWLDADTCVVSDRFMSIFAPLQFYDFVSVWECCAVGARPTPAVGDGWEIQTGVFGIRRSANQLLVDWDVEFGDGRKYGYSSVDQQAITRVFEMTTFRFYPLQAQFNWRGWTVSLVDSSSIVGAVGSRDPVVVHHHGLDSAAGADRHASALADKDRVLCDVVRDSKQQCHL